MKGFIKTALMFSFVLFLTSCHTVEGIGKDMQEGGKALSKSAEKNA
jgi:predicted small secreted protein